MTNTISPVHPLATGRHYLVTIDGSCKGNPGPGGWGALVQLKDGDQVLRQRALAGRETMTTNVKMEMAAAIKGLERLADPETPAVVMADNQMLINGMTHWIEGWKVKGWKGSNGPVANRDLWERLDALCQTRQVGWVKVAGHSGHDLNDIAHQLAGKAALRRYPKGERSVKDQHPDWFC